LDLDRQFDAALMMFNVIGYMTTNDDLMCALRAVRQHLDRAGLFIFDFWYGPGLMASPPGDRTQRFAAGSATINRFASGRVRGNDQCCDILIQLRREVGNTTVDQSDELHQVRYFFPLEIELALLAADFRLLALRKFPDVSQRPDIDGWGAVAVASAGRVSAAT
jgi:SAM-dependent methyltransferase